MRLLELIYGTPNANDKDTDVAIAFRHKYWRVSSEYSDVPLDVINDISKTTSMSKDDMEDAWPIISMERPDIVVLTINDDKYYLDNGAIQHPRTSPTIKKVVNQLGQNHPVVINDDREFYDNETYHYGMKGELPDFFYHGTTSTNLAEIAKFGLMPNKPSNWEKSGISHYDLIFGTIMFGTAIYHANKQSSTYGDVYESFPVVLKISIPNKDLLVPDYDVASTIMGKSEVSDDLGYTGQPGYGEWMNDNIPDSNPEGRLWKSAGIFGYRGRIPAKFITMVYANPFATLDDQSPEYIGSIKDLVEIINDGENDFF